MFITMEGTDGAGKSVQTQLLKNYFLTNTKVDVVLIRDPGSTIIGEKLRDIVLDKNNGEMSYRCEALIYAAARAQMVSQIIKPALIDGKIVLCDRYIDSSFVYQGICRNLGIENIKEINNFGTAELLPDITIFLDLPTEIGISRKGSIGELDRIELENNNFHEKVRQGYLNMAKLEPDRIKVVNANQSIDAVNFDILKILKKMI